MVLDHIVTIRPRRTIDASLLLGFCVLAWAFPATGLGADFREAIRVKVQETRQLQSPRDALNFWGDPYWISGVASPQMVFLFPRSGIQVTLVYWPPARAPHRLEMFDIEFNPAPAEEEIIAWLGSPLRVEENSGRGRMLMYDGADRAKLRVWFVWWKSGLNIRFDGAPR